MKRFKMPEWAKKRFGKGRVKAISNEVSTYQNVHAFFKASRNFKVYKKVMVAKKGLQLNKRKVIELTIPKGAIIHASKNETKMRASKAISHGDGFSIYSYIPFQYEKGKTVHPKYGFSRTRATCARGIHFFMTYNQARSLAM